MPQPTAQRVKPNYNAPRLEYLVLLKTVQKQIKWTRNWPFRRFRARVGGLSLVSGRKGLEVRDGLSVPLVLNGEFTERLWCFLTGTPIRPKLSSLHDALESLQG